MLSYQLLTHIRSGDHWSLLIALVLTYLSLRVCTSVVTLHLFSIFVVTWRHLVNFQKIIIDSSDYGSAIQLRFIFKRSSNRFGTEFLSYIYIFEPSFDSQKRRHFARYLGDARRSFASDASARVSAKRKRADERRQRKRASTRSGDDEDVAVISVRLSASFSTGKRSSFSRVHWALLFARSVICTARRPAIGPREGSVWEGTRKERERRGERGRRARKRDAGTRRGWGGDGGVEGGCYRRISERTLALWMEVG